MLKVKQSAYYFKTFWISIIRLYKGLETGEDVTSYVLIQNKIKIVLTTPLNSKSLLNNHIKKHGDGVKVICFMGRRRNMWEETTIREAKSFMSPIKEKDEFGEVIRLEFIHMEKPYIFVERNNYKGVFLPGYRRLEVRI